MAYFRRRIVFVAVALLFCLYHFHGISGGGGLLQTQTDPIAATQTIIKNRIDWNAVPQRYPVESMIPLPSGTPAKIPNIQYKFGKETKAEKRKRQERLEAIRESFLHSYRGYQKYAWLQDEVTPLSGEYKNGFGGWGATLIDTLDTLWIMGMKKEFAIAVAAVEKIDFTSSDSKVISVFETTIRYVGGLLGAYDLSRGKYPVLLKKAVELGDFLYAAFDTPNRMPITYWEWEKATSGEEQEAGTSVPVADLGSLSMEFTRLTQLTGDPKYFDAVQRIYDGLAEQQNDTRLPGMWPLMVNARKMDFTKDATFTFGAMSDSLYEYFPKQYLLVGGLSEQYRKMYEGTIKAAKKHIFFRPLNEENRDILVSGTMRDVATQSERLDPEGQHLTCFVGGMVGIGAKVFNRPEELDTARRLTDGCIWSYEAMPTGIGPEIFRAVPCLDPGDCTFSLDRYYHWIATDMHYREEDEDEDPPLTRAKTFVKEMGLFPGFTEIRERKYILRPEAIESVFIMYRITGDKTLQDKAWDMFQAVNRYTRTDVANRISSV
ncbi:MAG: hypothetical protein Q9157_004332 [Trypethelium eluteriae]